MVKEFTQTEVTKMKMRTKIFIAVITAFALLLLVAGMAIGEIFNIKILPSLCGVVLGLVIPLTVQKIQDCFDKKKWQPSLRKLWRGKILKKNSIIRISFAYLFRIKVDGKYFLVKNARGTQKYQPIGGAYKYRDSEKQVLSSKFHIIDDDNIPIDESSQNDYRFFVHAKDLRRFIKHFDATIEREHLSNLSREFNEELVKNGIVNFTHIEYRYCGRHFTEILYSRYFQCYELLMADVVELVLTKTQEATLRSLMTKKSDKYYFASSEEIKCLGVEKKKKLKDFIADHTEKILQETEVELENANTTNVTFSIDL